MWAKVSSAAVATAVATLVGIFVAGVSAAQVTPAGASVAAWWPGAGLAVALVALVARPWAVPAALAVVVVSAAANQVAGRDADVAVLFGLCNGVEALVAGWLLRRTGDGRPRLDSLDDVFRLVGACLAGASLAATGAAATVAGLTDGDPVSTWRSVLASHGAATLVLVPLALSWRSPWPPRERLGELLVQGSALAVVTAVVFSPIEVHGLAFAPLPFLVWTALRLGTRMTALQLVGVAVATTWATARGVGPFIAHDGDTVAPGLPGSLVQGFVLTAALMSLPLAVTVAQRHELLQRLRASESVFRSNFTEAAIGMLLLRRDAGGLTVMEANEVAAAMLGRLGPSDVAGRPLSSLLADPRALEDALPDLEAGRAASCSAESDAAPPHTSRVRLHLSSILDDEDGACFAAQMRDVTEEHRSRLRLREERELLRATLAATAALIVVTDTDGRVVRVNAAALRATGLAEADLLGSRLWERVAGASGEEWFRTVLDATPLGDLGPSTVTETDVPAADGRTLRIAWTTDVVRDAAGHPTHVVLTGTDVTAERAAAGLMSRVMDSDLGTALLGMDRHGVVTQSNRGASRLLGLGDADLTGRLFTDLLDPAELAAWARGRGVEPGFAALAGWASSTGAGATREWTWRADGGPATTVSTTLSVVRDAGAGEVGWFCVGRDVTASRRSHELLVAALEKERHASDRLRELDAAKNDFVSTVSHELRTPVTSIVGYAEMLTDGGAGELDTVQASMLAAIERNGQRLIALADDLLTLSRLESGTHAPDLVPLDLRETVRSAETAVRSLVTGRWLDAVFEVPDVAVPVRGDAAQLDRVLLNLLSNAVKFTEDGGSVRCTLRVAAGEAELEVADTGIGVPESEQPALFSKFYRSTTAQERAIQGTGLGLSIVASIVEAHGGAIDVRSTVDVGTTFTVRLPLQAGAAAPGAADQAGAAEVAPA